MRARAAAGACHGCWLAHVSDGGQADEHSGASADVMDMAVHVWRWIVIRGGVRPVYTVTLGERFS